MWAGLVMLAGVAAGLLAAAPGAVLLERALGGDTAHEPDVGQGLVAVLSSFCLLSLVIALVFVAARDLTLPFGCVTVAAFLAVWGTESVRAARLINGGATAKGKDEQ